MMLLLFIVDNGSVYDLFEQTPSIDIISIVLTHPILRLNRPSRGEFDTTLGTL